MAAALLLAAGEPAVAVQTIELVGGRDGFGLGAVLNSGDVFDRFLIPAFDPAEGIFTDRVLSGGATLRLDYAFTGTVTSAQLEIFSGGWGLFGPAGVYVNRVQVGRLTIAEDAATLTEYVFKDTFDLTPMLTQLRLSGSDVLEVRPVIGSGTEVDYGAVDYVQLTVVTGVPEPATRELWLPALAGVAAAARRRRRR